MTHPDPESSRRLRLATQEAVSATSTAYTEDASVDVERRLLEELRRREVEIDDDAWLDEVAHRIRSGHRVVFDPADPAAGG